MGIEKKFNTPENLSGNKKKIEIKINQDPELGDILTEEQAIKAKEDFSRVVKDSSLLKYNEIKKQMKKDKKEKISNLEREIEESIDHKS